MKSFMTACFFAFVATQIVAAEKCSTQAECPDANKCCAGIPPFGGNCLNHTPEGGKCHLEDKVAPIFFGEYIIGPCPCAEGLICESTGGKKKNDGVCVKAPTPAPEVPAEPTDDTPVEEPAADDTPAEEPAADDTPAEEPAADDTPVEEPAADDTPAEEPAADDAPAEEPAADDAPAEEPAADSSAADSVADSSAGDSVAEP
ncbi:hypothetical protein JTE90_014596 [Oedothorax gibbosus]|uniref:Prokineticin domain-containing protein n=1 Tax=Oedothorax gibbosus TaxID=931172 RepID=A0AAV6V9F7_9ARAC|nr:hypothetical protein JTE90_014596 [Oedothorax gibbosus]